MTWDNEQYIKLLLLRPEKGADRWLIALRATADHYGWTEKFPRWRPKTVFEQGGYSFVRMPNTRAEMFCERGRRHRICRAASKHGTPRGMTNQFKVSKNCSLLDLAELGALTKVDWHWMTAPNGERLDRAYWLSIHEVGPRRRGGGLVSD